MEVDNLDLSGLDVGQVKNIAQRIKTEVIQYRQRNGVNLLKNFDLYNNQPGKHFTQRYKEDNEVFAYRQQNPAKSNFVRFVVDLSAKYLYGRATKVRRDFGVEKDKSAKITGLIKEVGLHRLMYDSSKKAAVAGEQLIRFVAVDKETKKQPPNGQSTPNTIPYPVLLDPLCSYAKQNAWGKLLAVYFTYKIYDYKASKEVVVHEFCTDVSRAKWSDDSSVPYTNVKNYLPLDTEYALVVNNEDRLSDIEDIRDLSVDIVEAYTDMKHFHARHGWPQLLTEVDLSNVAHSPNRIWQILSDIDDGKKVTDRVAYLTWDGKMKEAYEYATRLERNLFILSNTARISTGDLEAIGNLRSGAALTVAHSVAIHKTQAKQIVWEANEKKVILALLAFESYLNNTTVSAAYPDLDIVITYPMDFVPGDELQRMQVQQGKIQNGLCTITDALKENYPELDEAQIEEKRTQVLEDQRELSDSTRVFESVTAPTPGGGTPTQKSKQQTAPKAS